MSRVEVAAGDGLMQARLRTAAQWAALIALSALLIAGLELLRLPAALLLGSLAGAAALTAFDVPVRVPPRAFAVAQAIIGLLIARVVAPSTVAEMARDWPTFLGGVLSVIVVSAGLGWLLARLKILPGSTAVWGAFPGAATVMTLMCEGFGADVRLVALMQYLRVVMVAVAATTVGAMWTAATPHAATAVVWFPLVHWGALATTAALAIVAAAVGRAIRFPAGPMLIGLALAVAAQFLGFVRIELPPWLLAPAYCLVGWSIGGRFNRPALVHAAKVLPALALSIVCLLAICGGIAVVLAHVAHVDPLTAYLATSPGGVDSIAIIAASTKVDMPFIMAMQMARFLIVLVAGPTIARFVATHVGK